MGKSQQHDQKGFDTKYVYNEKHVKAKIKSFDGKIETNCHNNKIWREGCKCVCLSVTWMDSVYRKDTNYYPKVIFEECKFDIKEKTSLSLLLMT